MRKETKIAIEIRIREKSRFNMRRRCVEYLQKATNLASVSNQSDDRDVDRSSRSSRSC